MTNLWGHWTDLNQTWTHIHLWLLFEKFGPNSTGIRPPPHELGRGAKNTFWGPTLNFDQTYPCNGTWYQQSERNLSIYKDYPTCSPWTLVHNGWERLASYCPPIPTFSHSENRMPSGLTLGFAPLSSLQVFCSRTSGGRNSRVEPADPSSPGIWVWLFTCCRCMIPVVHVCTR